MKNENSPQKPKSVNSKEQSKSDPNPQLDFEVQQPNTTPSVCILFESNPIKKLKKQNANSAPASDAFVKRFHRSSRPIFSRIVCFLKITPLLSSYRLASTYLTPRTRLPNLRVPIFASSPSPNNDEYTTSRQQHSRRIPSPYHVSRKLRMFTAKVAAKGAKRVAMRALSALPKFNAAIVIIKSHTTYFIIIPIVVISCLVNTQHHTHTLPHIAQTYHHGSSRRHQVLLFISL